MRRLVVPVDEIKVRISVEEILADEGISLKGGRCRCPLHDGDNPTSFSVSKDGQTFFCFACNESGDVISLTQRLYRLEFKEAVRFLAQKAGISDIDFDEPVSPRIEPREIDWDEHFEKQEDETLELLIRLWERVLKRLDEDLRDGKIGLSKYYADQQWAEYQLSKLDELSIWRNYEKNRRKKTDGKKVKGFESC